MASSSIPPWGGRRTRAARHRVQVGAGAVWSRLVRMVVALLLLIGSAVVALVSNGAVANAATAGAPYAGAGQVLGGTFIGIFNNIPGALARVGCITANADYPAASDKRVSDGLCKGCSS